MGLAKAQVKALATGLVTDPAMVQETHPATVVAMDLVTDLPAAADKGHPLGKLLRQQSTLATRFLGSALTKKNPSTDVGL